MKIRGTELDEYLTGTPASDLIRGGRGSDTLYGDGGDDVLFGGRGADYLVGSEGTDVLFGGKGRDSFVFRPSDAGVDVVQDFNPRQDKIIIFNEDAPASDFGYDKKSGAIHVNGEVVAVADFGLNVRDNDFHIVFV